jgi:hypothetical protein
MGFRGHTRLTGRIQVSANRVEQERARSAAGVDDALLQRLVHRRSHDLGSEPIRRVVLAEAMALLAVDERLVEQLENVDLYVVKRAT